MTPAAAPPQVQDQHVLASRRALKADPAMLAVGVLLIVMTSLDFVAFARQPLGIDEVWTGMIAGQTSLTAFVRQCQLDVNAPLAYVISWLWAPFGGLSNGALRLPFTLFVAAAPFVALIPTGDTPRSVRLIWAALLACWAPDLMLAQEARCYGLIILLATAATVAFVGMLHRPTLIRALAWTSLSSLLILDHYFAALLVGCQGLIYLAFHRLKAVSTWPAALAFAPALMSLALKAAMLARFAKPGIAPVSAMHLADLPAVLGFLVGAPIVLLGLAAWGLAGLVGELKGPGSFEPLTRRSDRLSAPPILAACAALAACVIAIGSGFLTPILNPRYLTIMVPGVLLGLAMLAHRFGRRQIMAPVVLVTGFFALALGFATLALVIDPGQKASTFSFQTASQALIAEKTRSLVFFWDNPANQGGDSATLAKIGGFFFTRAGAPIAVDAVKWTVGADPNRVLVARARVPGTAILWIYDRNVAGTLALGHPPAIARLVPAFVCHDFGGGSFGVIACHRPTAA